MAKTAFQVHGVKAKGEVVVAHKVRRGRCRNSSAHHWARLLIGLGREVDLIPPTLTGTMSPEPGEGTIFAVLIRT